MPEERLDDYLGNLDELAALAYVDQGFPPTYDEWNATNLVMGRPQGSFWQYMEFCRNYPTPPATFDALVMFGAVEE